MLDTDKRYSIHLIAHDINVGIWDWFDHWFTRNGKEAGHSALVLKDEDGEIVSRIDGSAYDTRTGQDSLTAGGLSAVFNFFARPLGLSSAFDNALKYGRAEKYTPRLRAQNRGTCYYDDTNKVTEDVVLLSGSEADIKDSWRRACQAAHAINKQDLPYIATDFTRSGQNCHSVSATVMRAVGLELTDDMIQEFAIPGTDYILLSDERLEEIRAGDYPVYDPPTAPCRIHKVPHELISEAPPLYPVYAFG